MIFIRSKKSALGLLVILMVVLTACQPAASAATHYAAAISGTEAFIGIAISGQEVTAYVCDGTDTTVATISEWFKGTLSGDSIELSSSGGAQLTGNLASAGVQGTVVLADGQTFAFSAAPAGAEAGLFRAEETFGSESYVAGWIVLDDGQQRGGMGYEGGGGVGKLAITPIPIPRLPRTLKVVTSLGEFSARRVGG